MPANISDLITSTTTASGTRPRSTTVSTIRSGGGTTLSCDDLTGWPTDSAVHFVTYQVDGNGKVVEGSQSDWKGIVSGSDINSLVLTGGTDDGNSVGDYVEMLPTAAWGKDLYDGLTSTLNQVDGTLIAGIVTTAKLGDSAVTTAKIAANNVGIIRLSSTESTDVQNGTALSANTWTDAIANKNFTVDNSDSVIQISYAGSMQILSSSNTFGSSRLVIDSAGTPQNIKYGGGPITSSMACNPLTGGSTISITGLSAGTHTVKLQVLCGAAGNQYLRASSQPNQEFMTCTVVEIKK